MKITEDKEHYFNIDIHQRPQEDVQQELIRKLERQGYEEIDTNTSFELDGVRFTYIRTYEGNMHVIGQVEEYCIVYYGSRLQSIPFPADTNPWCCWLTRIE